MLRPQVAETLTQSTEFIFVPTQETEYEQLVELLDEISDTASGIGREAVAQTTASAFLFTLLIRTTV